jgi:hypothetical protein
MLDPHREIQALVDNFVVELSELAKRLAIEQLKVAFGAGGNGVASPPFAPARPSRARRGQHEIEALRGKLLAEIAERPGCRAENLNSALGTKTPEIAQPLRRLVAEQLVRTEGVRRGTRYFVIGPDLQNGRRVTTEAQPTADEPPPA